MISFFMRARNEQMDIARCLNSILALDMPKEVVVLLDRCTDTTQDIVHDLARIYDEIKPHTWTMPYARAGLETLVTPKDSPFSLPHVMNYLHSLTRFPWRFHVGADFELTPELRDWLQHRNTLTPGMPPVAYRIAAVTPEDGTWNEELYLSNCLLGFGKHIFWDVPIFARRKIEAQPDDQNAVIIHHSTLAQLKPYWEERPWWLQPEHAHVSRVLTKDITVHYDLAVALVGPEPRGCARGSNPACDSYLHRVMEKREELEMRGISFFQ